MIIEQKGMSGELFGWSSPRWVFDRPGGVVLVIEDGRSSDELPFSNYP